MLSGSAQGTLRVAAVDEAAARAGLERGMRLADARALTAGLVVAGEIDPKGDALFLSSCASACERFTPLVALDGEEGLLLDITGCAHLFGGESGMLRAVAALFERIGLSVRTGLAATPDAARALSRFAPQDRSSPQEAAALRRLPVAALDQPTATTLALVRAGLKTLGDLAARPPAILAARFGEDLLRKLDRVLGHEDIRIAPLRAPPDCLAERHLAEPVLHVEAIGEILAALLADLCAQLDRRGQGGRRFELSLFRLDGEVRSLAVETSAACREPAAILRLIRLRIDALADPIDPGFGFDALRLGAFRLEAIAASQSSFDKAPETAAVSDLVDRLVARFGRSRVLRFAPRDSHDPCARP